MKIDKMKTAVILITIYVLITAGALSSLNLTYGTYNPTGWGSGQGTPTGWSANDPAPSSYTVTYRDNSGVTESRKVSSEAQRQTFEDEMKSKHGTAAEANKGANTGAGYNIGLLITSIGSITLLSFMGLFIAFKKGLIGSKGGV